MKTILFLAKYPLGTDIRDGMAQRISAVDDEFKEFNRIYIFLHERNRYEQITISPQIIQYNLNPFIHFNTIKRLIQNTDMQYMHSVYNSLRFFPFYKFCTNLVLDVHGVVPEEMELYGKHMKAKIYDWIERTTFKDLKSAVVVSNSMQNHFLKKYPFSKRINYILKTINPTNTLINKHDVEQIEDLRKKLEISNQDIVFLYSGNTQKWQNINLMLDCIRRMDNPNYVFIILTQNKEDMCTRVQTISSIRRIIIDSVDPEQLGKYYSLANYGFVLRDDITVNRVAAPTKIIEYLSYGLTPIVKSPNIGDWAEDGYEYVDYETDLNNLPKNKSAVNVNTVKRVLERTQKSSLINLL